MFLYTDISSQPLSFFKFETEFEKSTIQFCKDWFEGKEKYFLNTSGSTGKPKKIVISRAQMQKSAEMTAKAFNLKPNDKILVNLNTKYIAGLMMLARGLHLNLQMTAVEPSANPYDKLTQPFDFYAFVPMQLQTIIEQQKTTYLTQSRAIIVGGAPITAYQEQLFIETKLPIYSTYGMTETCTHVAVRKIKESNFKALNNVFFDVDERNCLIINSPTSIKSNLKTNDVVQLISNTSFIWKGRFDNIINTGGIKIQVEELERKIAKLFAQKHIEEARFIISSLPDEKLGEKIILISEKKGDIDVIEEALTSYEQPKKYFYMAPFPETETGKIDRNKLIKDLKSFLKSDFKPEK